LSLKARDAFIVFPKYHEWPTFWMWLFSSAFLDGMQRYVVPANLLTVTH